jgi:cellulose synthase/poly-beta-1,6-N-acetylglucosamine synthase-like glycosyltransferase
VTLTGAKLAEGLYLVALSGLAIYALHVLTLIVLYLRHRRDPETIPPRISEARLPAVTVQVPLRNEKHVARRVLEAVGALDWPNDRLEIQILDDSDDETCDIVDREAAHLCDTGLDVRVLRRAEPEGYKAGALAQGCARARGAFIALFDADFKPAPDFLRLTIPYLVDDPTLGMVQARWTHLNDTYSPITRVQALALDAHFSVEHVARNRSGLLINFNGTAGVWRKAAIADAGGWQSDTVTEDLDLSYRAQLAGWHVLYLPDVTAPAELPPLLSAFKAQQVRWAKGASQCLRKLSGPILRSERLTWVQKVMALLHLSGYFNQVFLLMMILLTLPLVLTSPDFSGMAAVLGGLASVPPLLFVLGQMALYRDWPRRVLAYPLLMLLGVGLAWSNTRAVVSGLLTWGGAFIRTPKFHIWGEEGDWRDSVYRPGSGVLDAGELAVGVYAVSAVGLALWSGQSQMLPLVVVYALGELVMIGLMWRQVLER